MIDGAKPEVPHEFPGLLSWIAPYSDIQRIDTSIQTSTTPAQYFGSEPRRTWCYYYEKADLARQMGDWQQVAVLGDVAIEAGFAPKDDSEWLPFVEGYAAVGRCDDAREVFGKIQQFLPDTATDILPAVCEG